MPKVKHPGSMPGFKLGPGSDFVNKGHCFHGRRFYLRPFPPPPALVHIKSQLLSQEFREPKGRCEHAKTIGTIPQKFQSHSFWLLRSLVCVLLLEFGHKNVSKPENQAWDKVKYKHILGSLLLFALNYSNPSFKETNYTKVNWTLLKWLVQTLSHNETKLLDHKRKIPFKRADTSSFSFTQELSAHNMDWLIDFGHKQD